MEESLDQKYMNIAYARSEVNIPKRVWIAWPFPTSPTLRVYAAKPTRAIELALETYHANNRLSWPKIQMAYVDVSLWSRAD